MQGVFKRHCRLTPRVNDDLHYLPQDLNQPYPPGFCVPFGKQDQVGTTQLRQEGDLSWLVNSPPACCRLGYHGM